MRDSIKAPCREALSELTEVLQSIVFEEHENHQRRMCGGLVLTVERVRGSLERVGEEDFRKEVLTTLMQLLPEMLSSAEWELPEQRRKFPRRQPPIEGCLQAFTKLLATLAEHAEDAWRQKAVSLYLCAFGGMTDSPEKYRLLEPMVMGAAAILNLPIAPALAKAA